MFKQFTNAGKKTLLVNPATVALVEETGDAGKVIIHLASGAKVTVACSIADAADALGVILEGRDDSHLRIEGM